MTNDNTQIGLSRRHVLGGIGAIGVASAGAGLGTTAFFSDSESFEGNTLTAGTLALNVTQTIENIDQDGIGPDELAWQDSGEGEADVTSPIVITDAKPGDTYEICWDVEIEGNPGFALVKVDGLSDHTGAEAGNVFAEDLYDIDDDEDMVTLGEAATAVATLTLSDGEEVQIFPGDGEDESLGALLDALAEGLPVPAGSEDVEGEEEPVFCHAIESPVTLCIVISISTDVGNELQGAESSFDLHVYAEQCRHNDVETFVSSHMPENDDNDDDLQMAV